MKKTIIALLLVACCITTCFVGGTFAKYTSSTTLAGDTARVALWAIEVEGKNIAVAHDTITFDLFSTAVVDTVDGNADADVEAGEQLIAPGTKGEFVLDIVNNSEVNAKYSIDYTVTKTANIPIEFSVDGTNWTSDLADVTDQDIAMTNAGDTDTVSITVQWRWAFERGEDDELVTNDTADTTLGAAGTATVTVTATITVTQVD